MSKRGLRNLKKESCSHSGQPTSLLRTQTGRDVEAVSRLSEFAQRYAPRATKRCVEVVSRFLDYLFEAGVFEDTRRTTRRLNAIIDDCPVLLRNGTELTAHRVLRHATPNTEDHWLAVTATALGWFPIKAGSFSNTLAAVNHFLPLSESLAREEYEHASLLGVEHNSRPDGLIKALQGKVQLTCMEVHRSRLNSMTGSVAEYAEKGIWRQETCACQVLAYRET